ncbi:hypothetical protein, partial [Enterococcus avium]|uniref:hypothetical protein n=1 Tax=Enterococcus avium TaxID=33945 RepID=UPI0022E46673
MAFFFASTFGDGLLVFFGGLAGLDCFSFVAVLLLAGLFDSFSDTVDAGAAETAFLQQLPFFSALFLIVERLVGQRWFPVPSLLVWFFDGNYEMS